MKSVRRLNMQPQKHMPDYILVANHCVGLMSLLCYLKFMGSPSTLFSDHIAMLARLRTQYETCGLTVDKANYDLNLKELFGIHTFPVVWVIRDPIEALTTYINWHIGEHISCSNRSHWFCNQDATSIYEAIAQTALCGKEAISFLSYSETFTHAACIERLLVIDTQDLAEEKIYATLCSIASFISITIPENLAAFYHRYNDYIARRWAAFPLFNYNIHPNQKKRVCIIPQNISDGYLFARYKILNPISHTIEHNGENFNISFVEENSSFDMLYEVCTKAASTIPTILDIRKKIVENDVMLYKSLSLTPEKTVDLIKKNTAIYKAFTSISKKSVELVKKISPNKLENWKYYHEIL